MDACMCTKNQNWKSLADLGTAWSVEILDDPTKLHQESPHEGGYCMRAASSMGVFFVGCLWIMQHSEKFRVNGALWHAQVTQLLPGLKLGSLGW